MTRSEPRAATISLLFLSFITGVAAAARAAEHDEAGARVLFAEGRKLADAGQYVKACLKFEESLRLDPGVGTSFNLADCQEHLGRTASAWARFLDVAAATKLEGQVERERVARARAAALEPRLARLAIEVSAPVEGLVVERDGVTVGPAAWGVPVPVDPGEHFVAARAPGRTRWSGRATIPDAPATVVMSVPVLEASPPEDQLPAAGTVPSPPVSFTAPGPLRPVRRWSRPVVVLGAVGVAGLAAAAVFALELRSDNQQAKSLCLDNGNMCDGVEEQRHHNDLVHDAHRNQTLAFVGAGVGAAALLTAAYLRWRPSRAPSTAPPRLTFAPLLPTPPPLTDPAGVSVALAW